MVINLYDLYYNYITRKVNNQLKQKEEARLPKLKEIASSFELYAKQLNELLLDDIPEGEI